MSTLAQQRSIVTTVRRIVIGAAKMPSPRSSEAKYMGEILGHLEATLAELQDRIRKGKPGPWMNL